MLDAAAAAPKGKHLCLQTGDEDVKYSILWVIASVVFTAVSFALGYAVNGVRGLYAAGVSHGIQWVCCCFHAFPYQTEIYYDLTGSVTYISIAVFTLLYTIAPQHETGGWITPHPRQVIATALVVIWATRLGSYLFARIKRDTKDGRFTNLKPYFVAFFGTWTIQGTWVFLTGLSVWANNQRFPSVQPPFNVLDGLGIAIWVLGFGIEVLADHQKSAWRRLPPSKGRYIDVGLWRYSRHPNYFGEFVLWVGQFVLCASSWATMRNGGDQSGAFLGAGWLCVLSPLFVYFLLNYVSGVPLLEKTADERWGGEAAYQAYKRETWVFFLLPTRRTEATIHTMASISAEGVGTYVSPTPPSPSLQRLASRLTE